MNVQRPPKWAYHFLLWFVSEELREEVCGDLMEAYEYRLRSNPKWKTDLWFILDVIRFFRPYSFEKFSRTKQFIPMFNNYYKIALRNIIKRKGFTAINLGGLTVSLSVVLIVALFLNHHLTYDSHYPDTDRIFRLENEFRSQSYAPFRFDEYYGSDRSTQLKTVEYLETFSFTDQVAFLLQSDAAISQQSEYILQFGNKEYIIEQALFTNTPEAFLQLFPQTFLKGSADEFSANMQQVLLTETLARRMFGPEWKDMSLVGRNFTMDADNLENNNYQIAGVVSDAVTNSHFTYSIILNTPRIPSWAAYTYFKTNSDQSAEQLTRLINERYDELEPEYGQDERYKGAFVQSLTDIHVSDRKLLYELKPKVNPSTLSIFGIVALVILIITWTNYMNLSIALYSRRQKEIGIRKVMGAHSRDIIYQLLVEITLISMLAFPLSMLLVSGILPAFNELMDVQIPVTVLLNAKFILGVFLLSLITGMISGLYPSIVFSRRNLLKLFKSKINESQGRFNIGFRRALIGLQFVLLIIMLSLTAYIYQQMNFIHSRSLGFNQSGVLTLPTEGIDQHKQAKALMTQFPEVEHVGTGSIPGTDRFNQTTYKLQGEQEVFDDANVIYADLETMKAIGVDHATFERLKEGQNRVFLVNEAMARKLSKTYGFDVQEIIGKTIIDEPEYVDPETGVAGLSRPIVGILQDINYFSLRYEINPMIFVVDRETSWAYNTVIKLKPGADINTSIRKLEEAYFQAGNQRPFTFTFLDQSLNELYKSDQRSLMLITALSVVSIVLALVGLVALVSYMVFTRKKEIGIRKVFGASVSQILFIINKEFIILMILATVIASPFVYFMVEEWLSNFAYRIDKNPLIIGLAGVITLFVVTLVVSLQSRKAANANPTEALTEE